MLLRFKKMNKIHCYPMLACKGKNTFYLLLVQRQFRTILTGKKYVSVYKKFNMHIVLLEVNSKDIIMKVSKDMLKLETT